MPKKGDYMKDEEKNKAQNPAMGEDYDENAIDVLTGLEGVRMRPGMYIGSTGSRGLHQLVWEILDNAVDELANGYGDRVVVTLHADGSCSVEDNGRGIPVGINPKAGVSSVEVVFTKLHAGGKFSNKNYHFSGGLHGVGASAVNALSSWLEVKVYHEGYVYEQRFHSVENEAGEMQSGKPIAPLKRTVKTDKRGTYVRFMPDSRVFETIVFNTETIAKHMQDKAFMTKGAHFVLIDKRKVDDDMQPYTIEYCYEGGIIDLVKFINESKDKVHDDVIYIEDKTAEDRQLEVAIQYTDDYTETIASYVNNIPTTDGGTHETGFKSALTRVLNDYARMRNILKEKDANFVGDDFREGLTCVLLLRMEHVQYEGQVKGKLGSVEAKTYVEGVVTEKLGAYLADKRNWAVGDAIVAKAMTAQRARVASKKAKDIARQKNSIAGSNLIGKLAPCTGRKPELNEVFIVEGDSAGGTAKQCRNRQIQAILPLRGKIINAEKKRIEQLLDNEEICNMIAAFGAGFGNDFNVANLKYNRIIILADADQDGGHIRCLLITFFYRYMRELITEGHVFCGMPPLYRLAKKDVVKYVYSDQELEAAKKEMGRNYTVQRYKGLGEMSKDQLWETTMDPERRSLIRVTLEDGAMAERMVSTLMGENIEARKDYISQHADFNRVDDFVRRD